MLFLDKINKSQLYTILISIRLFEYICSMDMYSKNQILGVLISLILQVVLLMLFFLFFDTGSMLKKIQSSKVLSWIYVIYLVIYGSVCFKRINLINEETSKILNGVICVILFGITCLYCAKLGYKSLLRSSVAVIFFVGVSFIILIYGVTSKMSIQNIYSFDGNYNVLYYTISDLAKNIDLIFLILLTDDSYSKKQGYKYLCYKTLGVLVLSIIGLSVLGGVDIFSKYPFLTLGAYSQPFGIQRADGLYTLIITMVCVLNISISVIISSDLLKNWIKSKHKESCIVLVMILVSYFIGNFDLVGISAFSIVVLTSLLPCCISFSMDTKKSKMDNPK